MILSLEKSPRHPWSWGVPFSHDRGARYPISNLSLCNTLQIGKRHRSQPLGLRPVAAPRDQRSQLLQPLAVDVVEPAGRGAVDVDDGHDPAVARDDGHDDLAAALRVARDVARERVHVRHQLRLLGRRRRAAHAAPKRDGLARDLALEGSQDELGAGRRGEGVEGVEACCLFW